MGPKSMREPHQGCASRCACTAAAAPWTPSFLYAFAARLPTVLIEIPNSNAISLCVMPRALRSSVAHSRTISGRGCDAGDRLTVRPAPTPVVPHAWTRWPTGAARERAAYCAHPGQAPPHRGTRAASRRSGQHERQRSSRDWLMLMLMRRRARRAGCGQNWGQTGDRGPAVARGKCPFRAEGKGFEPLGALRLQRFSSALGTVPTRPDPFHYALTCTSAARLIPFRSV